MELRSTSDCHRHSYSKNNRQRQLRQSQRRWHSGAICFRDHPRARQLQRHPLHRGLGGHPRHRPALVRGDDGGGRRLGRRLVRKRARRRHKRALRRFKRIGRGRGGRQPVHSRQQPGQDTVAGHKCCKRTGWLHCGLCRRHGLPGLLLLSKVGRLQQRCAACVRWRRQNPFRGSVDGSRYDHICESVGAAAAFRCRAIGVLRR